MNNDPRRQVQSCQKQRGWGFQLPSAQPLIINLFCNQYLFFNIGFPRFPPCPADNEIAMNTRRNNTHPLSWPLAAVFAFGAAACFHIAYSPIKFEAARLAIIGYLIFLTQLARLKTTRIAFYAGLVTGFLCIAPQLTCFWNIFGPAAIVLWLILAVWIGAFTGTVHAALERFGRAWTAALVPFIWMGFEYFRSELYYLKFSWLNIGYAFSGFDVFPIHFLGMYGIGFLVALLAALPLVLRWHYVVLITFGTLLIGPLFTSAENSSGKPPYVRIAGVQMEFPNEQNIPAALDSVVAQYTNADIVVLSEYTLDGPVPNSLKDWCRNQHRYLVVGGKDPAPNNNFYDTAFVISPEGEIVFRQVKSVPIQFFKDGLPAPEQKLWDSPWGKIGFCVCYDLSYTRVIDRLVKQGTELIIVPTMDVADWGEHQHQLHALVAPIRAAEYNIPIFRVASSGISQAVSKRGSTIATAPFPGDGKTLFAGFSLGRPGSLPADRTVALLAVTITGALIILFCFWKPKSPLPVQTENVAAEKLQANDPVSTPP
jgi:apolipoprotein N-acyltransferase